MKHHGSAYWHGGLKDGGGRISTESGALSNAPYGFKARFENERGANPEELIGAAHAACFSMALSKQLQDRGFIAELIETDAAVTLQMRGQGFEITRSDLSVRAVVPNCPEQQFRETAEHAKHDCPVSKLLNADIGLHIEFSSHAQPESHA